MPPTNSSPCTRAGGNLSVRPSNASTVDDRPASAAGSLVRSPYRQDQPEDVPRARRGVEFQATRRAADPTGWIMMHRRLARDYEAKPAHSEGTIRLAMISNLAKRVTGETPVTWHNP